MKISVVTNTVFVLICAFLVQRIFLLNYGFKRSLVFENAISDYSDVESEIDKITKKFSLLGKNERHSMQHLNHYIHVNGPYLVNE